MIMEFIELNISGCYLIKPNIFSDERGRFVKTVHFDLFREVGLDTNFHEEYFSESKEGVLRGMHFQLPPHDHTKLVYCINGKIEDAFFDLRKKSPTFQRCQKIILDSEECHILYLPSGIAHGFNTLSNTATMVYKTTSVHSPESDSGILWNSCGVNWKVDKPIISERDQSFPPVTEFKSPF